MAQDSKNTGDIRAVGRRKTSVARIRLVPGSGIWHVNGRALEEYFPRLLHRKRVEEALQTLETPSAFDFHVRVRGGGITGQADAIRLALARALLVQDEDSRVPLRRRGLLTRDPRAVERKKPGRPKARKRFQFSKR